MNYQYKVPQHHFTLKSDGILRMLFLDIEICKVDEPNTVYKTKGIWDTGATSTVITQEVVDFLKLNQVGITSVSTASITNELKPTYLVDIFLKKDLIVRTIEVTVGNIAAEKGMHCLIGMDIITLGDFSISNFEGKTCFSFRIPSLREIDYGKQWDSQHKYVEMHLKAGLNFNSPCICKTGKKFKNCHGKDLVEVKQ